MTTAGSGGIIQIAGGTAGTPRASGGMAGISHGGAGGGSGASGAEGAGARGSPGGAGGSRTTSGTSGADSAGAGGSKTIEGAAGSAGTINAAGAAGGGPVWTGCFCGTPGCGACPTNVEVDVGGYWIDALEVSNNEYLAFLNSSPDPGAQAAVCSWNFTFLPDGDWPLLDAPNQPVAWIDWCDAYAYCAWAGKRLCGAIGGGASRAADSENPLVNQWYNACSSGGQNAYPYGNTYDRFACNGSEFGWAEPLRGGALLTCATEGTGIYDMSGNVYEWEDSCNGSTGGLDVCLARGGSFYTSNPSYLRCQSATSLYERRSVRGSLGFRCCRDNP